MVDKDRPAQPFEGQRQLRPVAYRILGSGVNADDAVQDVWIRLSRSDIDHTTTQLVEQARAEGVSLIGPGGMLTDRTKRVLETRLEIEMTEHLGYEKHAVEGRDGGTSRNGTLAKAVLTEIGPVNIEVPRDRQGTFEPQLVRKRQTPPRGLRRDGEVAVRPGMITGDIEAHLAEVYETRVS